MADYLIPEAPPEFWPGVRPEPWACSDQLAAGLAYQRDSWQRWSGSDRWKFAQHRAHNYRAAAATLIGWAEALEEGDPLEPGTAAYAAASQFTCAHCGGTFEKEWSDDEAMAEAAANWGDKLEDPVPVCDDCYRAMTALLPIAEYLAQQEGDQ